MNSPHEDTGDARSQLARQWAAALAPTAYVPMSPAQVREALLDLVGLVLDGIAGSDPDSSRHTFERVGERLVELHFTSPRSLDPTIQVLGAGLAAHPELSGLDDLPATILAVLGGVSAGYARAIRTNTLEQQEGVNRALLVATKQFERRLEDSEARFRGVFTSTEVGIAITDLEGYFVEVTTP
jgi:PAS domain-containing protein